MVMPHTVGLRILGALAILAGILQAADPAGETVPAQIDRILRESRTLLASEPEKALQLAGKARDSAKAIADFNRELEALNLAGEALKGLNRIPEAIASRTELIRLLKPGQLRQKAVMLIDLGYLQFMVADYEPALRSALEGLRLAEQLDEQPSAYNAHYLVGLIHRNMGNTTKAIECFQEVARFAEKDGNTTIQGRALNEVGNVLMAQRKYTEALSVKQQALALAQKQADVFGMASCNADMGSIHLMMDHRENALNHYLEAYRLLQRTDSEREIGILGMNISSIMSDLGRMQEAAAYLKESRRIFEKAGMKGELATCLHSYANVLQQSNPSEALRLLLEAYDLNSQIFQENATRQIAEMQAKYETDKKQRQIELLQKNEAIQQLQIKRVRLQWYSAIGGLGLLLLLGFLLYNRYRLRIKYSDQIHQKNQELTEAYRQLEITARTDPLTKLFNRREIMERLDQEKLRVERSHRSFSIALGDIDNFKSVNDRFGHDCGDAVLKKVSELIQSTVRRQDSAGRWGGEEFILLFPETGLDGARIVAEKLRSRLEDTLVNHNGIEMRVTMTFGVCQFVPGSDLEACLKMADEALYRGKESGRNRVELVLDAPSPAQPQLKEVHE